MSSPVCHWVRSVLAAYLDGELKPSTTNAVRRHLAQCAECRKRAAELEAAWNLLEQVEPAPVRRGFTERMMARVVEEKELEALEARLRPNRILRQVATSVLGLAAGLLIGLALYGWTGQPRESNSPIEREVSRHTTFLEDADLLDEIAVIEAIDRLTVSSDRDSGA
jgi:anti-sigma factor RsiW